MLEISDETPAPLNVTHVINKPIVSYDLEEEAQKQHPEFKPGDTPYCMMGGEKLNGNVEWRKTILSILLTGYYTIDGLAQRIGADPRALWKAFLLDDASGINFKCGAKLLTIHTVHYPEVCEQA